MLLFYLNLVLINCFLIIYKMYFAQHRCDATSLRAARLSCPAISCCCGGSIGFALGNLSYAEKYNIFYYFIIAIGLFYACMLRYCCMLYRYCVKCINFGVFHCVIRKILPVTSFVTQILVIQSEIYVSKAFLKYVQVIINSIGFVELQCCISTIKMFEG